MSNIRYSPLPGQSTAQERELEVVFAYDSEDDEHDGQNAESKPLNPNRTQSPPPPLTPENSQSTYDFENLDYDYPPPGMCSFISSLNKELNVVSPQARHLPAPSQTQSAILTEISPPHLPRYPIEAPTYSNASSRVFDEMHPLAPSVGVLIMMVCLPTLMPSPAVAESSAMAIMEFMSSQKRSKQRLLHRYVCTTYFKIKLLIVRHISTQLRKLMLCRPTGKQPSTPHQGSVP